MLKIPNLYKKLIIDTIVLIRKGLKLLNIINRRSGDISRNRDAADGFKERLQAGIHDRKSRIRSAGCSDRLSGAQTP